MFGRATITLGIGPHSSYLLLYSWKVVDFRNVQRPGRVGSLHQRCTVLTGAQTDQWVQLGVRTPFQAAATSVHDLTLTFSHITPKCVVAYIVDPMLKFLATPLKSIDQIPFLWNWTIQLPKVCSKWTVQKTPSRRRSSFNLWASIWPAVVVAVFPTRFSFISAWFLFALFIL